MDLAISGYRRYVTRSGDTYDMIAISVYDEEKMASYIVKANPQHMKTLIFDAGITLRIPIFESTEAKPSTLPPWRR